MAARNTRQTGVLVSGKNLKKLVWLGLAVLLAAGVAYTMRPQPLLVDIGSPTREIVQEFIAEEAITRLAQEYTVAMPINGTLERITLEVGDEVTEGETIALVVPFELEQQIRSLNARIEQARAQLSGVDVLGPRTEDVSMAAVRAREAADTLQMVRREREITLINLENARRNFERAEELFQEGVAPAAQRDEAQRALRALQESIERAGLAEDAAEKALRVAELNAQRVEGTVGDYDYQREIYRAEIDSLEAQRLVLTHDLDKADIKAPVSGPVLEKYIDDQRVLAAGTPLLKLGDLGTMEVESDILSEEVVRIGVGDPVEIHGRALQDSVLNGTVTRIYPSAFRKISSLGIEQQRVKVLIGFDNTGARLRVGTRLDVRVIVNRSENALAIPERATFRREGQWYVFAVEGGIARLRPIRIGLKNDTWAEILEGIDEGTQIVLEPRNEMEDGVRVTPRS